MNLLKHKKKQLTPFEKGYLVFKDFKSGKPLVLKREPIASIEPELGSFSFVSNEREELGTGVIFDAKAFGGRRFFVRNSPEEIWMISTGEIQPELSDDTLVSEGE